MDVVSENIRRALSTYDTPVALRNEQQRRDFLGDMEIDGVELTQEEMKFIFDTLVQERQK